jgi:hypothetical protein
MANTRSKARRHPELRKASAEMAITGRIRGTGKRLTDQERAEMRRLRETNRETYTLRLAAIFGLDTGSVFYAPQGRTEHRRCEPCTAEGSGEGSESPQGPAGGSGRHDVEHPTTLRDVLGADARGGGGGGPSCSWRPRGRVRRAAAGFTRPWPRRASPGVTTYASRRRLATGYISAA